MIRPIDETTVNAIRVLSADAIQKAKSGHPGMPLGAAPMAFELWARHMKHNPADPDWPDRDRFVLSGGHASMLLYSLLHLFGYGNLSIEDIRNFRQWGSRTPGHPEYGWTSGVEATTGPLGAGIGMAVGMAMAEEHLAAVFNEEGYPVVDHYTYTIGGDGCMMEGMTSETLSFAGTMKLSKLIVFYDSNQISIEGDTDATFTEDVAKRMEAFGFQTLLVEDGTDMEAIGRAIEEAKADKERPSFITVRTQIGYGCPAKQGKASSHGEPLGAENVAALKETLGWPSDRDFYVPQEVYDHCRELAAGLVSAEDDWKQMFAEYCEKFPQKKALWDQYFGDVPMDYLDSEDFWKWEDTAAVATRNVSGKVINRIKDVMPNLIGGSADLGPSNKTVMDHEAYFYPGSYAGRNIHFGVREMAMTAETNGMLLHGGLRPYCATFFIFSDYTKPMARLSAIMKIPTIFVFSHDSIGVGEDGPTHEPIEQLTMFRSIPNFHVFRPADANETIGAWYSALTSKDTPTAIILTRQSVPQVGGDGRKTLKGAYILRDSVREKPDGILIASGSETHLAMEAAEMLALKGQDVRVVSMVSMDVFEEQSEEYRESILPKSVRRRVGIEASAGFGMARYTGLDGAEVIMRSFGASAPSDRLFREFGFTAGHIVEVYETL
ncbi:MAG: transketolase [Clostridiales bacterium]|nr:transketolase [Clostridiales bacterium]